MKKIQKIYIPFVSILFLLYCILRQPPHMAILYAFCAGLFDLIFKEFYTYKEVEEVENGEEKSE